MAKRGRGDFTKPVNSISRPLIFVTSQSLLPVLGLFNMNSTTKNNSGKQAILVADDDPACLDVLVNMLATLGYNVFSAVNGKEAVEAYVSLKNRIDLVILDMKMPFNGEKAFTKLRKIDNHAKILLITGFVEDFKIGNLLVQGYSDFVQKPFNLNTLKTKVRNIFKS